MQDTAIKLNTANGYRRLFEDRSHQDEPYVTGNIVRDRINALRFHRANTMREIAMQRLVPGLIELLNAKHIWIFGSVAKGEPSEDSDLDVLVESGDAVKSLSFKNRMNIAYDVLFASDLPFGCDLIIWTSDELAEKQHLDSLFFNSVWKNKMVIHGN